jgi:hypothetical protein
MSIASNRVVCGVVALTCGIITLALVAGPHQGPFIVVCAVAS